MKLAKKLKSNKGFTLVELVVVIAVLAILAGVGSVAYSGYIKKANEAKDVSLLAAVKTAADAAAAAHSEHFAVAKITVSANGGVVSQIKAVGTDETNESVSWTSSDSTSEFAAFLSNNDIKLSADGKYASGAEWTSDGWKELSASGAGG